MAAFMEIMDSTVDSAVPRCPLPTEDISSFLSYANVSESYRDVLVADGITKVDHLKDATEEDLLQYGKLLGFY